MYEYCHLGYSIIIYIYTPLVSGFSNRVWGVWDCATQIATWHRFLFSHQSVLGVRNLMTKIDPTSLMQWRYNSQYVWKYVHTNE